MESAEPDGPRAPAERPRAYGALAAWLFLALLQIILAFSATSGDSAGVDEPLFSYEFFVGSTIGYGLIVAVTLGVARAYPLGLADTLGLRRFALRWILIGLGVVVASLIVAAVVEPFLHGGEQQGLEPDRWHPDQAGAFVVNAVVIVLVAPFAEELFFRGLGVQLLRFLGPGAAIVGTAVAFGLAHGILGALPPLIAFALGLAWIRLASDSVWPGFVAHAAFNGVGLALAIASF